MMPLIGINKVTCAIFNYGDSLLLLFLLRALKSQSNPWMAFLVNVEISLVEFDSRKLMGSDSSPSQEEGKTALHACKNGLHPVN